MRKNIKLYVSFVIIAALVFGVAGCTSRPASGNAVVTVKTAASESKKLQTNLDVAGVLVPSQSVNITGKLSGQVLFIDKNVGDSVKQGEVLVRLETKTLNAQLLQAEAGLQSAKASAESVQNQMESAKINLDIAQKAYDDTKALYDNGAVSESALEDAANKLELTKKQYQNAGGSAQSQAQAAITTANANINNIRVQMENAVLKSPIDGIITNRNINPGEIASPGTPLLAIADLATLKLKGTVSQEMLPFLQQGQEINVTVDIYPDKVYKGKVTGIGPIAVSTGTVFPIEISLANAGDIRAGLSAHAIIGIEGQNSVVVPETAIAQSNGDSYVFVVKDGKVSKKVVTVGLKNDKEVQILKGLDANEQVAVSNVNSLFDNMPVEVVK